MSEEQAHEDYGKRHRTKTESQHKHTLDYFKQTQWVTQCNMNDAFIVDGLKSLPPGVEFMQPTGMPPLNGLTPPPGELPNVTIPNLLYRGN